MPKDQNAILLFDKQMQYQRVKAMMQKITFMKSKSLT
jgi:hypothetical protein